MNIPPITPVKAQPSFGIYRGSKKTSYGKYTWGVYRNHKVEVYDAKKYEQKLIYVSNESLLHWVASKFSYVKDGVKKFIKSIKR